MRSLKLRSNHIRYRFSWKSSKNPPKRSNLSHIRTMHFSKYLQLSSDSPTSATPASSILSCRCAYHKFFFFAHSFFYFTTFFEWMNGGRAINSEKELNIALIIRYSRKLVPHWFLNRNCLTLTSLTLLCFLSLDSAWAAQLSWCPRTSHLITTSSSQSTCGRRSKRRKHNLSLRKTKTMNGAVLNRRRKQQRLLLP